MKIKNQNNGLCAKNIHLEMIISFQQPILDIIKLALNSRFVFILEMREISKRFEIKQKETLSGITTL